MVYVSVKLNCLDLLVDKEHLRFVIFFFLQEGSSFSKLGMNLFMIAKSN